jgi:hypothetical protein
VAPPPPPLEVPVTTTVAGEGEEADDDAREEADPDDVQHTGANCAGRPEARWTYNMLFVFKYNPLGVEYRGRVGVCAPFIRDRGALFDLSNVGVGIAHEISPAYGHLGGYVDFAPLSILTFRVMATGLVYWEFPMNRAAYFPVDNYEAEITSELYPPERGFTATGWNVNFIANFQLKIDIGPIGLVALDSFAYELWRVGDEPYYVNLRHDVVMRAYDQVVANEAMLMVEIGLPRNMLLRVGAFDSLRWIGDATYNNHHLGLVAMLAWPELPRGTRNLTVFLRAGWYVDRSPVDISPGTPVIYLGLLSTWDLGSAVSRAH